MDLVLVTGHASIDTAVQALRGGAIDYLTKPIDVQRFEKVLAHVKRAARLRGQVGVLREELRRLGRFGRLIGASTAIQAVYDQVLKVARTEATVLVIGETGTGKELVAETLHELSARARGAVRADQLRRDLAQPDRVGAVRPREGQLHGRHRAPERLLRARRRRHALPRRSDRDADRAPGQAAARARERRGAARRRAPPGEGRRARGGGHQPRPERSRRRGPLREDLLYRLLVFPIHLPPLRSRGEDIELLADHFLAQLNRRAGTHKELTRAARERLRTHAGPATCASCATWSSARSSWPTPTSTPSASRSRARSTNVANGEENLGIRVGMSNDEVERILTLATLDHYGEKKRTAEVLGISLKTLYNRLKAYKGIGLTPSGERLIARGALARSRAAPPPTPRTRAGSPRRAARYRGTRSRRCRACRHSSSR